MEESDLVAVRDLMDRLKGDLFRNSSELYRAKVLALKVSRTDSYQQAWSHYNGLLERRVLIHEELRVAKLRHSNLVAERERQQRIARRSNFNREDRRMIQSRIAGELSNIYLEAAKPPNSQAYAWMVVAREVTKIAANHFKQGYESALAYCSNNHKDEKDD